ncbi:MAG: 3-deoxy-manno-octulosonate cytidylyltransferase [Candidatus Cloacimonetes bacterium]|nr:3-deoxy-manno-octulosonate cytidylyltransferase [Candidatus Cloacimonadota bacterium]
MLSSVAIIPSRFASTRLPGKPLRKIRDKTLIHHIYDNVIKTRLFDIVVVATDDERIANEVKTFHGTVFVSEKIHSSGTDRIAEVAASMDADVFINVQGDEVFINKHTLEPLINSFENENVHVATLAHEIVDIEEVQNPNRIKVICDINGYALYFSRSAIPYNRRNKSYSYLGHIGVYAFRKNALMRFAQLPQSNLEKTEKLEQLRLLENGIPIKVIVTDYSGFGIDTEEDIKEAELMMRNM